MHQNKEFRLRGTKNDKGSISLSLRIVYPSGRIRNIDSLFYLDSHTALLVVGEMVEQLALADHDVSFIAEFIDYLITKMLPSWKPSLDYHFSRGVSTCEVTPANQLATMVNPWDTRLTDDPDKSIVEQHAFPELNHSSSREGFVQADDGPLNGTSDRVSANVASFDTTPSLGNMEGKGSHASFASVLMGEDVLTKNEKSTNFVNYGNDRIFKDSSENGYDMEFRDLYYDQFKIHGNDSYGLECTKMNDFGKHPELTSIVMSLTSSWSSLSLSEKDDIELKLELDAIEAQYQHYCEVLTRMREEGMEAIRNRWMSKKEAEC